MDDIKELEKLIQYHNTKYWIENDPEISDVEYDALVERYKAVHPSGSLHNQIIPVITGRRQVKHKTPMLSLDKVYTIPDLLQWCSKVARNDNELFSIQPKYDGWSADYSGCLSTRGDGHVGEDITDKAVLINLEAPGYNGSLISSNCTCLGEIVFKKSSFAANYSKLVRKDGRTYKTERSALAGVLSPKETNTSLGPILTMVDYDLNSMVHPLSIMKNMAWDVLIADVQEWDYPTDGLVIKLHDRQYSESLGFTDHHPKGQIALKYGNPSGETILLDVKWFSGKGNTLTPVAIVDPIIIAGHEIKKANLHNAKNIIDMGIHIGDKVVIERCGEIIPDIVKVIPGTSRKSITIDKCPDCDSDVIYKEPFMYCSNKDCSGSLIKRLTDSCWRLGIENIGESTVAKLVGFGIQDIVDILEITEDELLRLPGFGETSAKNLYNEIHKIISNPVEDWKILSALNIRGIGTSMSKKIMQKLTLPQLRKLEPPAIMELPMVGESRAWDLYMELDTMHHLLDDMIEMLNVKQTYGSLPSIKKGSVCFTGKMPQERGYYEDLAEKAGFEISKTVSKDLTYLVCQDTDSTKGKMTKAISLGVTIVQLDNFLKMIA